MTVTERLDRIFLEGIVDASHERRKQKMREGFEIAVREGQDEYTFIFQSYIYWLDRDFKKAKYAAQNAPSLPYHRDLCHGHAYRGLADLTIPRDWPPKQWRLPSSEEKWQFEIARDYHNKAREEYNKTRSVVGPPTEIRMVSEHSVGRLIDISFKIELWDRMYGQEYGDDKQIIEQIIGEINCKCIEEARRHHLEACDISKRSGIPYAPPYNRLGQLCLKEYRVNCGKRKGEKILKEAIEYFQDACKASGDTPYAPARYNLALAVYWLAMSEGRTDCMDEVKSLLQEAVKQAPNDPIVHRDIISFAELLRDEWKEPVDEVARVILGEPVHAKDKALRKYFLKERHPSEQPWMNFFLVLRRWSSYTPTIVTPKRFTFGGGYLLDWLGTRIAIDPGYGFVRNLCEYEFNIVDLDAIVVTHGHPDHCSDLNSLLGLVYERECYAKELNEDEKNVNTIALKHTAKLESLKLLLPQSVRSKLAEKILNTWKGRNAFLELEDDKPIAVGTGQTHLIPKSCSTHKDLDGEFSRWLRFDLFEQPTKDPRWQIGITGDTRYEPELAKHFANCDLVIAHLSTVADLLPKYLKKKYEPIDANEIKRIFPSFEVFYKKHLGFWGTVKLIADLYLYAPTKRRLFLLSEFGVELAHERNAVARELERLAKLLAGKGADLKDWNIDVRPSDIGTRVDLNGDRVSLLCQFGGVLCRRQAEVSEPFEHLVGVIDQSFAHQPIADVEIQYLCEQHKAF